MTAKPTPARLPVVIDAFAAQRILAGLSELADQLFQNAATIDGLVAAEQALTCWADLSAIVTAAIAYQLRAGEGDYEDECRGESQR
jgi:hypothetical protein